MREVWRVSINCRISSSQRGRIVETGIAMARKMAAVSSALRRILKAVARKAQKVTPSSTVTRFMSVSRWAYRTSGSNLIRP